GKFRRQLTTIYTTARPKASSQRHRCVRTTKARLHGSPLCSCGIRPRIERNTALQHDLHLDGYVSFTIAILLLFVGKACTRRFELLRRYSIPEAVMGGLVCIAAVSALYLGFGLKVDFQLGVRDILLLYFFAAIGLASDVRTLRQGGWPLVV